MAAVLSSGTHTAGSGSVPLAQVGTLRSPGWPLVVRSLPGLGRHPGAAAAQIIHSTKPGERGHFCWVMGGHSPAPPEPRGPPAHGTPSPTLPWGQTPWLLPPPQLSAVTATCFAASIGTRSVKRRQTPLLLPSPCLSFPVCTLQRAPGAGRSGAGWAGLRRGHAGLRRRRRGQGAAAGRRSDQPRQGQWEMAALSLGSRGNGGGSHGTGCAPSAFPADGPSSRPTNTFRESENGAAAPRHRDTAGRLGR